MQAKLLADGGLRQQDVCVLAYYSKQVQRIRTVLRHKKLNEVRGKFAVEWSVTLALFVLLGTSASSG